MDVFSHSKGHRIEIENYALSKKEGDVMWVDAVYLAV